MRRDEWVAFGTGIRILQGTRLVPYRRERRISFRARYRESKGTLKPVKKAVQQHRNPSRMDMDKVRNSEGGLEVGLAGKMRDNELKRERNKACRNLDNTDVLKNSVAVRRLPGIRYYIEDNVYWDCAEIAFTCESCSALHLIGEKLCSSSLKKLKFENCCTIGQLKPYFPLPTF